MQQYDVRLKHKGSLGFKKGNKNSDRRFRKELKSHFSITYFGYLSFHKATNSLTQILAEAKLRD